MAKALTPRGIGGVDFIYQPIRRIQRVASDKDVHFTGALAKDASESENLVGLQSDRVIITEVTIQSTQSLHYRLLFFSKDTLTDSDLDVDTFLGAVEVDLPKYGISVAI